MTHRKNTPKTFDERHLPVTLREKAAASDPAVREEAAWELGRYPREESIILLIAMLGDDNRNVVYGAARSLVGIGGSEVVRKIIPLLRVEDATARNLAVEVLTGVGEDAVPQVAELAGDEDHDVRKFAMDILAVIGSVSAEATLVKALFDDNTNVAVGAAEALGRAGSANAVPHLISCFSREPWLKCAAIKSLGSIGGEEALQAIMSIGPGEESIVLYAAVSALGNIGDTRAIGYLVGLLESADNLEAPVIQAANRIISRSYSTALSSIRGKVAPRTLLTLLEHSNREVKKSAVVLLGMLREKSAVEKLSSLYTEENQDLFDELDNALVNIHPTDLTPLSVLFASKKGSPSVQAALVRLFVRLGRKEAAPVVLAAFDEADQELQLSIIRALPEFMDKKDLPHLHAMLKHASPLIRKTAAESTGKFKDPSSAKFLIALAADPDIQVRESACTSLAAFDLSSQKQEISAMLRSENEHTIIFGLGMIPQNMVSDFSAPVRKISENSSPLVRRAAVLKAGFLDREHAHTIIQEALHDSDAGVRLAGIRALEQCNFDQAGNLLLEAAAGDPDHWNRYEAVQIVGRRRMAPSVARLTALFEESPDLVQAAIIDALGIIGDESAVEIITKAENSKHKIVREAATEALLQFSKFVVRQGGQ